MSPIKNTEGKGIQVVTQYVDRQVIDEDYEYRRAAYNYNQQQDTEVEPAKPKRMKRTAPPSKPRPSTRQIRAGKACHDLAAERDEQLKKAAAKDLKSRNIKPN